MSGEDILAIIKWGPILLFLIIFLIGLISGMIKGNRKVIRRLIYVALYTALIIVFLPMSTRMLMTIEVNGIRIDGFINDFVNTNEAVSNVFTSIPGLQQVLVEYPNAIVSLLLFIVLMLIGLPLSFPIYWLYMIIYALISKLIFRYTRFQKDEQGNYVRNKKGKKIKKKKKARVVAGIIRGTQGVVLTSIMLTPLGFVSRLYKEAQDATDSKSLSSISYFESFEEYLAFVDAYNGSFIGFASDNFLTDSIASHITQIEINGEKTDLEKELAPLLKAGVYVSESGIIEMLATGVDINTLDLSKLKVNKLESAIEVLFDSKALSSVMGDGVNYVMENFLSDPLIKFTKDEDIISKLKYENSNGIKQELLTVTSLLKTVINAKLLELYRDSNNNYMYILNEVKTSDVEAILNKVLSIQILSKAMPSVVNALLSDYGLKDEVKQENNDEFVKLVMNVVTLAKTLEVQSLDDIMQGNMFDNIVNTLYVEGAIKSNTLSSLAELLANVTSSNIFDDVLVTQLNKVLTNFGINLNSQMIVNVNSKEDWANELAVLQDICKLYKDYTSENTVDFLTVNNLIDKLKNTKAMILAFPIAYKTVFPMLGIEIDASKIVYVDYEDENALDEETKFYNYWKSELVHLEKVTDEFAKLGITKMEDLSLDLLKVKKNEQTIANILGEVFSMDLLKDGVVDYLDTMIEDMLTEYDVTLNDGALAYVNNLVNTYPKYVVVDGVEYDVDVNNKYHNGTTLVEVTDEEIHNNTLHRVWHKEVSNLATVVNTLTGGDITSKENISTILNAVDNMNLFKDVKNDLLVYAVNSSGILNEQEQAELKEKKNTLSFSKEKQILINVIEKKDMITELNEINIETMDETTKSDLAYLLANLLDSDIFANKSATTMADIFNDVNIHHDEDEIDSNTRLIATIKAVEHWNDELTLMQTLTKIDGTEDVNDPLFTSIENSELLGECKYNVMIAMVKAVNDTTQPGEVKLNIPTISQLNQDLGSMSQYELEKEIIVQASNFDDFTYDNITTSVTPSVATMLVGMRNSVIFNGKYVDFVDNSIKANVNNADYGVTVSNVDVNTWDINKWTSELNILVSIRDQLNIVKTLNKNSENAASKVGALLDALDSSALVNAGSSVTAANKIAADLAKPNTAPTVTKEGTWEQTFEKLINNLNK